MSGQQPKTDATPQDAAAGLLNRLVRSRISREIEAF
jgi:hypothetical protein